MKKRKTISIKELQNRLNLIHPNENYTVLGFVNGSKNKIYIQDGFGVCIRSYYYLGYKNSINSAINKEEYLTNIVCKNSPKSLEFYSIIHYKNCFNITVKTKYGLCNVWSPSLISGMLPTIETAIDKNGYFVNQAKQIHQDRYDYSLVNYTGTHKKVIITCKIHGVFEQSPAAHLSSQNCPKCSEILIQNKLSGWSKKEWFKSAQKSKHYDSFKVYILELWNDKESFYKIGRTFNSLKKRFGSSILMPYNYKVLQIFEFKELTEENCIKTFDLEDSLKKLNILNKYRPQKKFGGRHECFNKILQ